MRSLTKGCLVVLLVGLMGCPAQQGSQGPQGEQGPQGVAGPQGPEGPAGPQGETGPAGPQGAAGPPGNANVQSFELLVRNVDWSDNYHYGDSNIHRYYDVTDELLGGTSLASFFSSGGAIVAYAQGDGPNGYSEWRPLPYVYSQTKNGGGYLGVKLDIIPTRGEIVISQTTNGWDNVSLPDVDLPEAVRIKLFLIAPPPA